MRQKLISGFMKERILAALKAKFTGVSADILDRIAAMLVKTVTTEEQVATAVEGVTEDLINVIEGYGDSRATGAQKTAVLNYERKYGLKDGAKIAKEDIKPDPKTTQERDDQTPAWAQALIDSNKQLTERLNKMEGERTTESRRAELNGIINRLPENQRKGYQRISVDGLSDEEFTKLKGEVTTEVEDLVKTTGAKRAVFGRPQVQGNPINDGKLTEAQEKAIAQRIGVPAEGQQPF